MIELTPIEEAAAEYEREIVHQSTQVAIGHVADVLAMLISQLCQWYLELSDKPCKPTRDDIRQAHTLAELVVESLVNLPPFDAADIVAVQDVGERLLNQEFAVEAVRKAVGEILKGLRYE